MPSLQLFSSNTEDMPPTVPCPPWKPISSRLPNAGDRPKSGIRTNPVSPSPMTYCPQAMNCPKQSCGNAMAAIFVNFGAVTPRKSAAKTTLMRNRGSLPMASKTSGGSSPGKHWKTASATTPPMIELGR